MGDPILARIETVIDNCSMIASMIHQLSIAAHTRSLPGALAAVCLSALLAGTSSAGPLNEAENLRDEDPRAALERLDTAIEQSPPELDSARLAELVYLRGEIRRDLRRLEDATADAERVRRLAEELDDAILTARALFLRGTIDAEQGDLGAALERFHEARKLLEGTDAKRELARVTNAIGVAHNFAEDFERARQYYEQALAAAREAGDDSQTVSILGNLALAVAEAEGAKASLELHREALALANELGNDEIVGYQWANLCDRLVELDRPSRAEEPCIQAIERFERLDHPRVLAGTKLTLGTLRGKQGRLDDALVLYEEVLRSVEDEVPVVERQVLERLSDLHERRGEPQLALDYLKRMVELREEMFEDERREKINELEVQYEVDQREREIELLELESELQAAKLERRNWMLFGVTIALVLAALLALVAWRGYRINARLQQELAHRNSELEDAVETIGRLAREDPLTGLLNRRAFLDLARHEQARALRQGHPLCVAMLDLDRFKPLNDAYGHAVGDTVLKEVASRLLEHLRDMDIVARWGGEEFLCLLPDTEPGEAPAVMERLRENLGQQPVATEAGPLHITLTCGTAVVGEDLEVAIDAADQAMYEGKRGGRDQVVIAGEGNER